MTFANPIWLLVALIALPCAWTAWKWFRSMSRGRALSAGAARAILLALLAMALAGAASVRQSDRVAVIGVVDVSDSVRQYADAFADLPPDATGRRPRVSEVIQNWLSRTAEQRTPDDAIGLVVFAGDASAVTIPTAEQSVDFPLDRRLPEGTDIDRSLRFAQGLFPPGAARRVVLFSDGRSTSGDALNTARELGALGTRVDVVPIAYTVSNEVMISAIDTPPNAAPGAKVRVRVVLDATDDSTGTLRLTYDGRELDINGNEPGLGRRLALNAGRHVESVDVELDADRVHAMRAVFEPDGGEEGANDRVASNNTAEAFTITPGEGSVLIVNPAGVPDTLSRTLAGQGIRVETRPPAATPTDLLQMQAFDLVILENVGAYDMPTAAHRTLREFVTTLGGGLVMTGGEQSFGAGGWMGTPLEDILPVKLDLPEQMITPQAAVAIVLDSSGSMSAPVAGTLRSQMDIATESAALAIATMETTDLIEVIAFNGEHTVIVPLSRNTHKDATADRVRAIATGGGTNMYPALARAVGDLRTADAKVKHVILLSDGQSMGDPAEGYAIAQLAQEHGITISTIAVGDSAASETLSRIAGEGGGQFYEVFNADLLPKIFIKEILVVRKPLIRLGLFDPVDLRSGSPLVAGIPGNWPGLRGLNLTRRREDPKITYALASPQGDPLMAHWYVGRGQVAAFMSDASAEWAQRWLDWPGYSALWSQIARLVSRPSGEPGLELTSEVVDGELVVRLDASRDDGRPRDMLSVPGTIYTPDGTPIDIQLTQTGPGVYETRLDADESGNYVVALLPKEGATQLPLVMGGASRALGPELGHLRSDIAPLRQIAEATGGRVLSLRSPEVAELFSREGVEPQRASTPLWQLLLMWALAVFLFDVGTRRVAWDRLVTRQVVEDMRAKALGAVRSRSDRAATTASTLRRVSEQRAAPRAGGPPPPPAPIVDRRPGAAATQDEGEALRAAARARMEEQRKAEARKRMLGRLSSQPPGTSEKPAPGKSPGDPDAEADTTSGLLRAKKRARRQMEGTDESDQARPGSG